MRFSRARLVVSVLTTSVVGAAVLLAPTPRQPATRPAAEALTADPWLTQQWNLKDKAESAIWALDAWDPQWHYLGKDFETSYAPERDNQGTRLGLRLVRYGQYGFNWKYALKDGEFQCQPSDFDGDPGKYVDKRCEVAAYWTNSVWADRNYAIQIPAGTTTLRYGWDERWVYTTVTSATPMLLPCRFSTFDEDPADGVWKVCQLEHRNDGGGFLANHEEPFNLAKTSLVRYGAIDRWTYKEAAAGWGGCVPAFFDDIDPYWGKRKHCEIVKTRGHGATIAVIDRGWVPHQDLPWRRHVEGGSFFDGHQYASDEDYGCWTDDDRWHGLYVTGVAAASTNNSIGISGVAPEAKLLPIKTFRCDDLGRPEVDTANAINFAASNRARVLNMSFVARGPCPEEVQAAIDRARQAGAVVIAAAGNDSLDIDQEPFYSPAGCRGVVTVVAVDRAGDLARFTRLGSNFGRRTVDLAAPGKAVPVLTNQGWRYPERDDYAITEGTSLSTAHVSGVAALMLGLNPKLSGVNVENRLMLSTRWIHYYSTCYLICGKGILDAARAMRSAEAITEESESNDRTDQANYISASADVTGELTSKPKAALLPGNQQGSCTAQCSEVVLEQKPDIDNFEVYLRPGETLNFNVQRCDNTCSYTIITPAGAQWPRAAEWPGTYKNATDKTERVIIQITNYLRNQYEQTAYPYTLLASWRTES